MQQQNTSISLGQCSWMSPIFPPVNILANNYIFRYRTRDSLKASLNRIYRIFIDFFTKKFDIILNKLRFYDASLS
nr:MAG TPA: hypothetical protein [Caudoviricetes sp.]